MFIFFIYGLIKVHLGRKNYMKFQLAVNLERQSSQQDMKTVADHTLEMVKKADKGGFNIVWSAEHHALEMTIAPDPFQLLTWWATHTEKN